MATVKIETEEDAIDLFLRLQSGEKLVEPDNLRIEFGDWVNINIYLPHTPVEGSISPTMMKAFVELQSAINRSYKLVESRSKDLRTLSNFEKDMLEFRVVVEKGSSDYLVQLIDIMGKIGVEAVAGMSPEMKLLTILGLALIISGGFVLKSWLASRAAIRQAEIESDEVKEMLQTHKEILIAALDVKKSSVADAIQNDPILKQIEETNAEAREQLVKAVGSEGGGQMLGTHIPSELASEITSHTRSQSQEVYLKGNYRILKVDSSIADGFTVRLVNEEDNTEISASLLDMLISADHKITIQEAEWKKTAVWLEIKAKKLNSRITEAVIVDAKPVDE
nr:hypothetical protein [Brucella intermedia]